MTHQRTNVDPSRTRAALRGGEAIFGAGLICAEVLAALTDLGLKLVDLTQVNFVTRSAPMGPVPAEVVHAAFYNFNPESIAAVIPAAWKSATPEAILAAQAAAFSQPLAAALSVVAPPELVELATLSRIAAEVASRQQEGRPLLAGLASLPWPTDVHMIIWHAMKILREHRGDGHIACLVVEGLSGIEALVVHEALGPGPPMGILRPMRGWSHEAWADAIRGLRRRDWLTDDDVPTLSEEGRRRRRAIEDRTDELAANAFEPIGGANVERMITIGGNVAKALNAAGLGLAPHVRAFATDGAP